jgi:hypothetical protein
MEFVFDDWTADWQKKNIEVVLETQVIQGRSGPPRVPRTLPIQARLGSSNEHDLTLQPLYCE